jgi:molybdate transport system substrate-binding protein
MRTHVVAWAVALTLAYTGSEAAEMRLLGSGATKEIVTELLPLFEKDSGHKVSPTWTGGADIRKRIAAGEVYDVVISNAGDIDGFVQHGKIAAGSRVDLMRSQVGVAVPEGASKPDISSGDTLKQALLSARAIGYSTGPSGAYIERLVERMGIADQVKPKLKRVPSGVSVGSILASKEADLGFQQVSELLHHPGITYLGPLPPELQYTTTYSAGIASGTKEPDAAKALVRFMGSPAAVPVLRHHGMDPS